MAELRILGRTIEPSAKGLSEVFRGASTSPATWPGDLRGGRPVYLEVSGGYEVANQDASHSEGYAEVGGDLGDRGPGDAQAYDLAPHIVGSPPQTTRGLPGFDGCLGGQVDAARGPSARHNVGAYEARLTGGDGPCCAASRGARRGRRYLPAPFGICSALLLGAGPGGDPGRGLR